MRMHAYVTQNTRTTPARLKITYACRTRIYIYIYIYIYGSVIRRQADAYSRAPFAQFSRLVYTIKFTSVSE